MNQQNLNAAQNITNTLQSNLLTQKSATSKRKNLLFVLLPIVVLAALLLVATFFDLQISKALADVQMGQYYSSNFFGIFFEIFGEMPVYFLPSFCLCVIGTWLSKTLPTGKKKKLATFIVFMSICFALSLALNFIGFKKITKYILRFSGGFSSIWHTIFQILLALICGYNFWVLLSHFSAKTLASLCKFSAVVLITAVITNSVVQLLKPVFGRLRFRAMTRMSDTSFSGFTPWYQANPNASLSDAQKALGMTSDIYKSFPSGHTASATIMLCLLCLPMIFKFKRSTTIAIVCTSFGYVAIVAFARIVMGAHYLSDTVVAFLIGYLAFLLSLLYPEKNQKYLDKKTPKQHL